MGVYAGPDVSESGLVLALDAGNSKGFDDDENLMTNSQLGTTILNDGNGVTLTTDTTIVNPFGAYDGVLKCVHTTNTPGYLRRGQLISLTAGVTYTFSFYFKNGTVVSPYGQNRLNIGLLASTYSPTFDETGQGLNQNTPVGDGWYRQVFTFTSSYTQTYQVDFNQTVNQTPLGTYYLYGFQLERGSSASPYYATTSTAKNRGTILTDLTGRGNNGTLTNGPTYNSSNGGSLVFDGADDYVLGTIPSSTFSGAHSIGCWFYRKTVTQWSGLFSTNVGTNSCPILTFIDSTNIIGTNQAGINGAYVGIDLGADHLNKWIYCVMTVSGSTNGSAVNVYAYKDGSLLTATGSLYWTLSSSSSYYVGRHYQGGSQIHNGNIPQVQIYNRALTAAEIQQNFNAHKGRFTTEYETLTYTASGNLTVTGNGTDTVNIFKTSGVNDWDNQAYSLVPFNAPCTIEFNKQAGSSDNGVSYAMIGWNADPLTNASYDTIDYASYPYNTGSYQVYHNGSLVQNGGSWSTANKFYIVYGTDGTIKHYNGSTLLYSVNYGIGNTVYVDSSFYSPNATFGGFSNIKVIRSAWNGTNYVYRW